MRSGYNDLFKDSDIDKTVLNWIVGIFLSIFFLIILGTIYFDYKQLKEVHPNDILIKKKNESNFILISQGDTSFYKENIPDCAQFVKQ